MGSYHRLTEGEADRLILEGAYHAKEAVYRESTDFVTGDCEIYCYVPNPSFASFERLVLKFDPFQFLG